MTLTARCTATAIVLLSALPGCKKFNPPSHDEGPDVPVADAGDGPLRDAAVTPQDAGDANVLDDCSAAEPAFQAFLAANRSCTEDSDCTTVGDCGPYIDHEPVNVAGAEEAARLQRKTCETGYDGETDGVACEAGVCVSVPLAGICCGCQDAGSPDDAGSDDAG